MCLSARSEKLLNAETKTSVRFAQLSATDSRKVLRIAPRSSSERSCARLQFEMGFILSAFSPRSSLMLRSVRPTSRAVRRCNRDRTQASAQRRLQASLGQIEPLSTLRQLQRIPVRERGRRVRSSDRAKRRAPFAFVLLALELPFRRFVKWETSSI
jgi:hypothetical protein